MAALAFVRWGWFSYNLLNLVIFLVSLSSFSIPAADSRERVCQQERFRDVLCHCGEKLEGSVLVRHRATSIMG